MHILSNAFLLTWRSTYLAALTRWRIWGMISWTFHSRTDDLSTDIWIILQITDYVTLKIGNKGLQVLPTLFSEPMAQLPKPNLIPCSGRHQNTELLNKFLYQKGKGKFSSPIEILCREEVLLVAIYITSILQKIQGAI